MWHADCPVLQYRSYLQDTRSLFFLNVVIKKKNKGEKLQNQVGLLHDSLAVVFTVGWLDLTLQVKHKLVFAQIDFLLPCSHWCSICWRLTLEGLKVMLACSSATSLDLVTQMKCINYQNTKHAGIVRVQFKHCTSCTQYCNEPQSSTLQQHVKQMMSLMQSEQNK